MEIKPYLDKPNDELMALLLLADPDEKQVSTYLQDAEIFVVYLKSEKVGLVVLSNQNDEFEIKNIAVKPEFQGKGIGRSLIEKIKTRVKELGAQAFTVGTGNSSLGQLEFYQRCGFRIISVSPNYFLSYHPPIYENGIRCIDMIVLRLDL